MLSQPNRILVALLTTALAATSVPAPAFASIIPTDRVIAQQAPLSTERTRVNEFLAREDVQNQLKDYGLSAEEASARVAALSDAEIVQIAAKLDELPAGRDGLGTVVSAAVLIFVVLLITDIACLTRVFPFTRCAR